MLHAILLICSFCIAIISKAQIITMDGNALFDDHASYFYHLQIHCIGNDTFAGTVAYIPRGQMEIKNKFYQIIHLYVDSQNKKIKLLEGDALGVSPSKFFHDVCYMQGTLDYVVQDGFTFCFGYIKGNDIHADSCSAGYVYISMADDLETVCQSPKTSPKKEIPKDIYNIAVQKLFAKSQRLAQTDSAIVNITNKPTILSGNTVTEILIDSDSLQFSISDYDTEDDDLISVYWNGKLIIPNYTLKNEALNFKLPISNLAHDTIMIQSHNIGLYAPNSALLLLQDNKKIYPFQTAWQANDKMILVLKRKR